MLSSLGSNPYLLYLLLTLEPVDHVTNSTRKECPRMKSSYCVGCQLIVPFAQYYWRLSDPLFKVGLDPADLDLG